MNLKFEVKYPIFTLLIFFAFLLISCSSRDDVRREVLQGGERITLEGYDKESEKNSKRLLTNTENQYIWNGFQTVLELFDSSEDCQNCDLSSGYLLIRDERVAGDGNLEISDFCQGNLFKSDVFIVNRSCLPEDLSSLGASCDGEIQVVLPRINNYYPMELLRCHQIILMNQLQVSLKLKDRASSDRLLE